MLDHFRVQSIMEGEDTVAAESRGCGSSSEGLYAHISADREAERGPSGLI